MPEQKINTEIDDGLGTTVWGEPDTLDEYEYDIGDRFVRWHPWGNERADEDVWAVVNVSWQFKTTWITDRDNPTTKEDHRIYELLSKETFDRHRVPETELKRGDWRLEEDAESE